MVVNLVTITDVYYQWSQLVKIFPPIQKFEPISMKSIAPGPTNVEEVEEELLAIFLGGSNY